MDISVKTLRKTGLPFPDWHVAQEIGSGTYGSVFRIENRRGDICALKVIPVPYSEADLLETMQMCGGDVMKARSGFDSMVNRILTREIGTAKQCAGCPNIFRIYEEAVVDDPENPAQRYIMVRMELLMESRAYITRTGARQRDVLRMMENVANALSFMEHKNIIHRDVKPANIMVDSQGVFKLTDFGEARVSQRESTHTVARGTPYYMAPEVATSGHYDHRADIYSLGMVAYYFLNGQRYPFAQFGVRPRDGYEKRMGGEACPPIPGVDARVNRIVLRCIAYRREMRYGTADELLGDLRELLQDSAVGQAPLAGASGGRMPGSARSGSATPSGEGTPGKRTGSGSQTPRKGLSGTAIAMIVLGASMFVVLIICIIVAATVGGRRSSGQGQPGWPTATPQATEQPADAAL